MIKISIIDDHPVILNGVVQMLNDVPDFEVIGKFQNSTHLLAELSTNCTDILLMDIQMPDINGAELAQNIGSHYPKIKIIALTNYDSFFYQKTMFQSGVKGYLLKTISRENLIKAIIEVNSGKIFLDPTLNFSVESFIDEKKESNYINLALTIREKQVAKLLAAGNSNNQIAEKLFLSYNTVRNHRARIFLKLEVNTISELINKLM